MSRRVRVSLAVNPHIRAGQSAARSSNVLNNNVREIMSDEKRGKETRSKGFIERIERIVAVGERQLSSPGQPQRIETAAKACGLKLGKENLLPRELMVKLTLALVSCIQNPSSLDDFDPLLDLLPPLKEIKGIVSGDEFEEVVGVRGQARIKDPRKPLPDFLNELESFLLLDKSKGRQPADQEPRSRRIRGFAPPDDDEGHEQ